MLQLWYIHHLAKDCPKPPWVNKISIKGLESLQGGFEIKVNVLTKVFNLLKVNCKVNNKGVYCLLDSWVMDLFMTPYIVKWLGVKTKLVANPILVHMA
jgi:hypothetical protein